MKALKKQNFDNVLSNGITKALRATWTEEQWGDYLREGLQNSLESLLEAGKRIYEFKTECSNVQGGSDFSKRASELLGISEGYARQWAKVGERHQLLMSIADKLPSDVYIIKAIAAQPADKITWAAESGFIHCDMKREDLGVIRKYDPLEVEKEKEAAENNSSKLVDMSTSSGGSHQGDSEPRTKSLCEESFVQDASTSDESESQAHKEKCQDKSSIDPNFKLLENEFDNFSDFGVVGFSYYSNGCEILLRLDSYEQLLSIVARILKFNNELDQEEDIDPRQKYLDLGYEKPKHIPPRKNSNDTKKFDPLYSKAESLIVTTGRVSISNLQRQLKIGYNRAARMIDDMEASGIVSEMETDGTRKVLSISKNLNGKEK